MKGSLIGPANDKHKRRKITPFSAHALNIATASAASRPAPRNSARPRLTASPGPAGQELLGRESTALIARRCGLVIMRPCAIVHGAIGRCSADFQNQGAEQIRPAGKDRGRELETGYRAGRARHYRRRSGRWPHQAARCPAGPRPIGRLSRDRGLPRAGLGRISVWIRQERPRQHRRGSVPDVSHHRGKLACRVRRDNHPGHRRRRATGDRP